VGRGGEGEGGEGKGEEGKRGGEGWGRGRNEGGRRQSRPQAKAWPPRTIFLAPALNFAHLSPKFYREGVKVFGHQSPLTHCGFKMEECIGNLMLSFCATMIDTHFANPSPSFYKGVIYLENLA